MKRAANNRRSSYSVAEFRLGDRALLVHQHKGRTYLASVTVINGLSRFPVGKHFSDYHPHLPFFYAVQSDLGGCMDVPEGSLRQATILDHIVAALDAT